MLEAVTPNMGWDQVKYLFHKVGIVALQESDSDVLFSLPTTVICTSLDYVIICGGGVKVIIKCILKAKKQPFILIFMWGR